MAKNPITIEVLETLDAIERRGSFAKAAEELNKATSAISYSIQKLEELLDISLFQRQGRRSVLTPAGRLILAEGREILLTTARLANKAKEVATGWEPRLSIAIESLHPYPEFFAHLNAFLLDYPSIEIDLCESVLNGGWEALDHGRIDLLVGGPGPVPLHKGYRAIALPRNELVPVIAAKHPLAQAAHNISSLPTVLPKLRRIITHDTSSTEIARSEGLSNDGLSFFVQNIDQKVAAIRAGIGIGHLPQQRIKESLANGDLLTIPLPNKPQQESYLVWRISNKGKGLQELSKRLIEGL